MHFELCFNLFIDLPSFDLNAIFKEFSSYIYLCNFSLCPTRMAFRSCICFVA